MAEVNTQTQVAQAQEQLSSSAASASAPTHTSASEENNQKTGGSDGSPWLTSLLVGVLTIALVLLLYYAYNRFVTNSIEEPMTKGLEQERDDPITDFNLREAIKELQGIQRRILSTLSEAVNI